MAGALAEDAVPAVLEADEVGESAVLGLVPDSGGLQQRGFRLAGFGGRSQETAPIGIPQQREDDAKCQADQECVSFHGNTSKMVPRCASVDRAPSTGMPFSNHRRSPDQKTSAIGLPSSRMEIGRPVRSGNWSAGSTP